MSTRVSTARWTGVFYLGVALSGLVGFLFVRAELYVAGDPTATLANLFDQVPLARFGIAADLTIVLTQALAAILVLQALSQREQFRRRIDRRLRVGQRRCDRGSDGLLGDGPRRGGRCCPRPERRSGCNCATALRAQWSDVGHRWALLRSVAFPDGLRGRQFESDASRARMGVDGRGSRIRDQYLPHPARPRRSDSGRFIAHRGGHHRRVLDDRYLLIFGVRTPDRNPPASSPVAVA